MATTVVGLQIPNSFKTVGLFSPVQFTNINGFSLRLWVQIFPDLAVPILKDWEGGHCSMLLKNAM